MDLTDYDGDFFCALRPYQRDLIFQLLRDHDEVAAAKIWLSSNGPLDLKKFGGVGKSDGDAFFEKFKAEFRAFVCGDDRYKKERNLLSEYGKPIAEHLVTGISVALALSLGMPEVLLAPAVALMLRVVGKMGLNAWCSLER